MHYKLNLKSFAYCEPLETAGHGQNQLISHKLQHNYDHCFGTALTEKGKGQMV